MDETQAPSAFTGTAVFDGGASSGSAARDIAVHAVDAGVADAVGATLRDYLDARAAEAPEAGPEFAAAVTALRDFVLSGGKRLRPMFAWWGWRGTGDTDTDPAGVLRAVSALELVQAGALLHDDLIDASAVRRGEPTVHRAFATRHAAAGWLGEPERFGMTTAVLLGDLALAWADDLFHGCGLAAGRVGAAFGAWRPMRTEVLAGQFLDAGNQARADESVDAALRVNQLKTAAYTVGRPLHLGGALGGADEDLLAAYASLGDDLGQAFQLRDDLLGVFGDPAVTGKPAGDDLREGKRTVLLAVGLAEAQRRGNGAVGALRSGVGRADLDADGAAELGDLLVELGAVAEVERRIAALAESAGHTLRSAPIAGPAADALAGLIVSVTARER